MVKIFFGVIFWPLINPESSESTRYPLNPKNSETTIRGDVA